MLFKPSRSSLQIGIVNYKGGIKKLLAVALRNRKLFSKVTNFRYLFKQERDPRRLAWVLQPVVQFLLRNHNFCSTWHPGYVCIMPTVMYNRLFAIIFFFHCFSAGMGQICNFFYRIAVDIPNISQQVRPRFLKCRQHLF